MYECFFFSLNRGIRGGDIGSAIVNPSIEYERSLWFWRFAFDLTFYLLVAVILLNGVVVGIITATFGELRAAAVAKADDLESVCFICNCPHEDFDSEGGFASHVENRHSVRVPRT